MKLVLLLCALLPFASCRVFRPPFVNVQKEQWIHGAADCAHNSDPAIQVTRYSHNTWILRQSKCVHYEAPFMFLFIGEKKALLMDTGATGDETASPLYRTIDSITSNWERLNGLQLELVVAHTHSHSDHVAADTQFKGKPRTTVLGLSVESVASYFNVSNWPSGKGSVDLGNRFIEIIPIPGHHETSIAVYDKATRLLLTGDSFYPGRLYVNDWKAFGASVQRLVDFTVQKNVSHILGNHIEMTDKPGKDYPVGTVFQPDEHSLPLTVRHLRSLASALKELGDTPTRKTLDHFIIYPVKN